MFYVAAVVEIPEKTLSVTQRIKRGIDMFNFKSKPKLPENDTSNTRLLLSLYYLKVSGLMDKASKLTEKERDNQKWLKQIEKICKESDRILAKCYDLESPDQKEFVKKWHDELQTLLQTARGKR